MMGIGNKLEILLSERNISAIELARRIDASPSTIYSIIQRNNKKVDIDILIKIAKALNIPAEYFSDIYESDSAEYYTNPATADMAQAIYDDPELRALFDVSRDLDPRDLKMLADMARRFKRDAEGGSDY